MGRYAYEHSIEDFEEPVTLKVYTSICSFNARPDLFFLV
jgi:hypothetical protein